MREAVEVVVDDFAAADKDLGMVGSSGTGAATPYASTPFASSPMVGAGAEMSPFVGDGAFSPAVGGASFSPAYSPESGSYDSGFARYAVEQCETIAFVFLFVAHMPCDCLILTQFFILL